MGHKWARSWYQRYLSLDKEPRRGDPGDLPNTARPIQDQILDGRFLGAIFLWGGGGGLLG